MSRVKRGNKRTLKRKKILKRAKGFYGTKSKAHRIAKLAVARADRDAFRGRKERKRELRGVWIVRINAAARLHGLSYSRLIAGLARGRLVARPQVPRRARGAGPGGLRRGSQDGERRARRRGLEQLGASGRRAGGPFGSVPGDRPESVS